MKDCKMITVAGYKQFEVSFGHKENVKNSQTIEEIYKNIANLNLVTSLSLQNCALKYLTQDICALPLRELDLMNNLFAYVPECLYFGLHTVEVLNLAYNPIKCFSIFPKCVGNLKVLNVEGTKLCNVPIWIQEMKAYSLEKLYFSQNKLEFDLRRRDCPELPAILRKLVFCNTSLKQSMLGFFKTFHLLEYLDLSNVGSKHWNSIHNINELITNVSWSRHIKVLKLNNLNIGELSDDVCKLCNLRELHLNQNHLLDIPAAVCNLRDLTVLDVSFNCICFLPDLSNLQMLEELHAAKNHLIGVTLTKMPKLRYIDLYDNALEKTDITFTPEEIDLELNYVPAGILLNNSVENYVERRESLRRRRTKVVDAISMESRAVGPKFDIQDLDSPAEEEYESEDADSDSYSNNYAGELEKHNSLGRDSDDDWSNWGDTTANSLITLSDAEYLPEEDLLPAVSQLGATLNMDMDAISLEQLFIDAD